MRGTQHRSGRSPEPVGIIPAYAGNTRSRWDSSSLGWDHPRVCGEHVSCSATTEPVVGSSPRMRGTPDVHEFAARVGGIIPAYAGNTGLCCFQLASIGDHPRVCGEHTRIEFYCGLGVGSSPRMRGTPFRITEIDGQVGIIPAYAGNTPCLMYSLIPYRDHPRVCGEHKFGGALFSSHIGSSPRMRGTHNRVTI